MNEYPTSLTKYNQQPTFDALQVEIDNHQGATDDSIKSIIETLDNLKNDNNITNMDWLVD